MTKCCKRVYPKERYGSFHGHGCCKKATLVEDGKPYCKTHAPSIVAAKEAARRAQWDAEARARQAKWDAEAAQKHADKEMRAVYPEMFALLERTTVYMEWRDKHMGDLDKADRATMTEARALLARIAKG